MTISMMKYDADSFKELVAQEGQIREEVNTVAQKIRDITDSDSVKDEATDRKYLRLCQEHSMKSRELETIKDDIVRMKEMKPRDMKARGELSAMARFVHNGSEALGEDERKQYVIPSFKELQGGFETPNGLKIEPRDLKGIGPPPGIANGEFFIEDTLSAAMTNVSGDEPGTKWNDKILSSNVDDVLVYMGGVRGNVSEISTANGLEIELPLVDDAAEKGEYLANAKTAHTERDIQNLGVVSMKSAVISSQFVDLNLVLVQDVAFVSEDFVNRRLARRIARGTNEALTTGDGTNDTPRGIVTDAGTGVTAASQTAFTSDELLQLEDEIDMAYFEGEGSPMGFNPPAPGRTLQGYMLHQKTKGVIRRMKLGNQYAWKPGLEGFASGDPPTILDRRYVINNFMDSELAAGKKLIAFGHFGYYTFRNVAFRIRGRFADSTTMANLNVRFAQWERNYGRFTGAFPDSTGDTTEAVKMLVLKA